MRHSSIETNVNTLYKELKNDEEIQELFKVFIVYNRDLQTTASGPEMALEQILTSPRPS